MSPTVFRDGSYRAFFFSREEPRLHVHISCPDGEAKFWLDPVIALAEYTPGLPPRTLRRMQKLVEENRDAIERDWKTHFGAGR
jgi:Domain of unknown function (DUF4160)